MPKSKKSDSFTQHFRDFISQRLENVLLPHDHPATRELNEEINAAKAELKAVIGSDELLEQLEAAYYGLAAREYEASYCRGWHDALRFTKILEEQP